MEPLETLKKRIEEEIAATSEHLAGGSAKDMTDYARTTGRIAAFRSVLQDISEIEKRYIDE
jgi:hypothetical protein